jgi:hypothetical protein
MAQKFLALIRIISPTDSRCHFVDRERFTIGRNPEADVLLINNSISRQHLAVEVKGRHIFVEDLGSSNGSFLNDVQLTAGKKYPLPERQPIRLGHAKETISVELIERPAEFQQFKDYLPQFNKNIQASLDQQLKDIQVKVDAEMAQAQKVVDQFHREGQAEGEKILLTAKIKAEQLIAEAERTARQRAEHLHQEALLEAEKIRRSAQAEAQKQAREQAERLIEGEAEMARQRLREQISEMKIQAQMQADELMQNAHREASKSKEKAHQEFEKLRTEGQERAQALMDEAERESSKIMAHSREASEKMRQVAQKDFDEALSRSQSQAADMIKNAESQAALILENARKRAQVIVENQEKESATILSDLTARIQQEAKTEAARILRETEDQIEESKAQARKEVLESQAQRVALDEKIAFLSQDLQSLKDGKAQIEAEVKQLESENQRLKEENEKQSFLNARLETVDKQVKALELSKIQIDEKKTQTEFELELLKKKTFEELERVRKDEERKVLEMASIKAKEFSQHLEKVIVRDINQVLSQKLDSQELARVSRRLTDEMIDLFASESFKHNEKKSLESPDSSVAPEFTKAAWFRWGVAVFAAAAIGSAVKYAGVQVENQVVFTDALIEKQKEELRFRPQMKTQYQASYTDNVLYMERYMELKNDPQVQEQWALNLNDFFLQDLRLSEEQMVRFIGLESAMLKRLVTLRESVDARYLEEGISRMREAEKEDLKRITDLLRGSANYSRLRLREKIFLSQISQDRPLRNPADQGSSFSQ